MKKIASIGSYNTGITVKVEVLPSIGETVIGTGYFESHGGKGANQAVAAAKLGAEVVFIGSVGQDQFGIDAIKMLKDEKVETEYIFQKSNKKTGIGIIMLNEANDNSIVVDLGANNDLSAENLEKLVEVIKKVDIVLFQLEVPLETVKKGMELSQKYNKTVIFNPAPATPAARELISLATIINPNESELKILTGKPATLKLTLEKCEELARELLALGPECVIVTRGSNGAFFVTENNSGEIPGIEVDVVDTTGAGDSFTGALGVALAKEHELIKAIKFANLVGAYTVTGAGVIESLPNREELARFNAELNYGVDAF